MNNYQTIGNSGIRGSNTQPSNSVRTFSVVDKKPVVETKNVPQKVTPVSTMKKVAPAKKVTPQSNRLKPEKGLNRAFNAGALNANVYEFLGTFCGDRKCESCSTVNSPFFKSINFADTSALRMYSNVNNSLIINAGCVGDTCSTVKLNKNSLNALVNSVDINITNALASKITTLLGSVNSKLATLNNIPFSFNGMESFVGSRIRIDADEDSEIPRNIICAKYVRLPEQCEDYFNGASILMPQWYGLAAARQLINDMKSTLGIVYAFDVPTQRFAKTSFEKVFKKPGFWGGAYGQTGPGPAFGGTIGAYGAGPTLTSPDWSPEVDGFNPLGHTYNASEIRVTGYDPFDNSLTTLTEAACACADFDVCMPFSRNTGRFKRNGLEGLSSKSEVYSYFSENTTCTEMLFPLFCAYRNLIFHNEEEFNPCEISGCCITEDGVANRISLLKCIVNTVSNVSMNNNSVNVAELNTQAVVNYAIDNLSNAIAENMSNLNRANVSVISFAVNNNITVNAVNLFTS